MAGKIYLIEKDGSLTALNEEPYPQENHLQVLLAKYPDLLAGDQINEEAPRRWLLVSREVSIPLQEEGGAQMSLDHLFLDQDAIPTLVEVKRSSDMRIRREVVGQMLDYAANAVTFWTMDRIRTRFEAACDENKENPAERIAELVDADSVDIEIVEDYWVQVKTNLQAGRIRLLFVADEIPPELRRIVEFLNRFMDPVEVLAVEVRQFVGSGVRTLVPRLIGQTAETQSRKSRQGSSGKQWDEETFLAELTQRQNADKAEVARRILAWAQSHTRIWWGRGTTVGAFVPIIDTEDGKFQLFAVTTRGSVELYFQWYQYKKPFQSEESRLEILKRLNAIQGITLSEDVIDRRPNVPFSVFQNEQTLQAFLDVFKWMIGVIRMDLITT